MMLKEPEKTLFTIPAETSWHFERVLKPDDKTIGNYVLIQPGAPDIAKVLKAYFHHPVDGYNIASIEIIYNAPLNREFLVRMDRMSRRKGNTKFMPTWKNGFQDQAKQQREETYQLLQQLSQTNHDPETPNIMILPLWHGTSDTVADQIFDGGYGIFTSDSPTAVTDSGFFGKGIYGAHEAEYAYRSYAKKHGDNAVLLLNWVSIFEAYPIIGKDGLTFKGKAKGHDECDAHFIPVYSKLHPHSDTYLPCPPREKHQYIEVVVFNEAQCLPRYRVKLIQSLPKTGLHKDAVMEYQSALDALNLGKYAKVTEAFEEAYDAGHPAAPIRLHWLHSGASGVIPANIQELVKYQTPSKETLIYLKSKANFKGDNDPEAQFNYAWCHLHGLGTTLNLAKAAQYFWIAAVQGHREAQYQLGVCCATGTGVKKDMDKGIFYYEQAAAQGHIHAHYLLSQCYELGLGVVPNALKSQAHQQAAQKGNHPKLAGLPLIMPGINPEDKKTIMRLEETIQQQELQLKQQKEFSDQDKKQINVLTQALAAEHKESQAKDKILSEKESQLNQKLMEAKEDKQKINELTKEVSSSKQDLQVKDKALSEKESQLNIQAKQLAEREETLKTNFADIDGLKLRLSNSESNLRESETKCNQAEKALQASQDEVSHLQRQLQAHQRPVLSLLPKTSENPFMTFQPEKGTNSHSLKTEMTSQEIQYNQADLELLFKWVTEGHLLEVEKLSQKNSNFPLIKGTIKDLSGRTFKNTSAFQYAAWALDIEMCELMLKFLDRVGAAVADSQLAELETNPGPHGAHYDIEPLVKKTREYLNNYEKWDTNTCCQYWQKEVGGEQRKCPAWLIYAWCEKGADVAWVKKDLKNIKVIRQYNEGHIKWWFEAKHNEGCGVGSKWGAARWGNWGAAYWSYAHVGVRWEVQHDVDVGQSVKPNRHEALTSLKAKLENKVTMGLKK